MLKIIISLMMLALLSTSPQLHAISNPQLLNSCFSNNIIYAVPACEQLIDNQSADHKVYFHLAKLYQKHKQLEKSRQTLEKALTLFESTGNKGVVAETARIKSNVDEEIWLQTQPQRSNADADNKLKCIKFSKILPQQALVSCKQYLARNPDDEQILRYQAIAKDTLMDSDRKYNANSAAPTVASRAPKAGATTATKSPVKKKPTTNKSRQPPATTSRDAILPPQGKPAAIGIDPQVIADIKNELSGLYAMLEKQQAGNQQITNSELGKRHALVIGNASYSKEIGKLKNSANDAIDISKKLKSLDFDVQLIVDGNLESLEKSVDQLARKIREDDTVLFYYAGHGVAIDGENYLLPTKMGIKDAVDVKYKSLNLSYVLDKLDRGSNGVTIVVLDACRNNPFPVSRGAASAGLVQSSGPVGTIIAYSTAPGDVALDGDGRNGLYTKHLLKEMSKENIKLEDMFKKVRVAVTNETNGAQVPWENSSLKGDFYFSLMVPHR